MRYFQKKKLSGRIRNVPTDLAGLLRTRSGRVDIKGSAGTKITVHLNTHLFLTTTIYHACKFISVFCQCTYILFTAFSSVLRVPLVRHRGQLLLRRSNPGVLTLPQCPHKRPTQTLLVPLHHLQRLLSPANLECLHKWLPLPVPLQSARPSATEFPICSSVDPTLQPLPSRQLRFNNNLSNPPLLVMLRQRTLRVAWTRQTCRAVRIILNNLKPYVTLFALCFLCAD